MIGGNNLKRCSMEQRFLYKGRISLEFLTIDHWDEELWNNAKTVYLQAFGKSGKPEKIIRNMFSKKICQLHVLRIDERVIGIAISGIISKANALLIDYIAIHEEYRDQGVGSQFLTSIKNWAVSEHHLEAIIIEVESETTPTNLRRIQYWKNNDFIPTDYITIIFGCQSHTWPCTVN
jgi:GNAT superfamily N-acetyltransferase